MILSSKPWPMLNEILRNYREAIFLLTTSLSFYLTKAQPDIQYLPFIPANAGLSNPIEMVDAPGDAAGRFFVVEKAGTIRIWNGVSLETTAFLDISGLVADNGERGLLSVAFHPQYQSNGYFFVYYNDQTTGNITIARYKVSGNPDIANPVADPVTPLLSIPKPFENHNGGHLAFRTEGGVNYLYFATGDGGSANDPNNNAQNPSSLLGKMIRLNADIASPLPEIWAWGLRNPFRWSFDRSTGDIWIGDVGQGSREEINFRAGGTAGANYGWVCVEGLVVNGAAPIIAQCDTVENIDVLPVFDYANPAQGRSVIGGYVYRGAEFPALQGYYLATDFYSGILWLIRPQGGGGWEIAQKTGLGVSDIASISEAADGSLYVVSLLGNAIYKIIIPIVTPVILSNFSGKSFSGYNELSWTAELEYNIDHYSIEYSKDGTAFLEAGELAAFNDGNSKTYYFRHNTLEAQLFYRLRINEMSGSHTYSSTVRITKKDKLTLRVYPSVVTNGLVNIVSSYPVQEVIISGTDGRRVFSKNINHVEGYFVLNIPGIPKGTYFLQVVGANIQQTEKIFIK